MSANKLSYEKYVAMELEEMASDIEFSSNKETLLSVLGLSNVNNNSTKGLHREVHKIATEILDLAASSEKLDYDPKTHVHGILLVNKDKKIAIRNAAAHVRYALPKLYESRMKSCEEEKILSENSNEHVEK